MGVYEELQERGLIAQITNEDEVRELINNGTAADKGNRLIASHLKPFHKAKCHKVTQAVRQICVKCLHLKLFSITATALKSKCLSLLTFQTARNDG